MPIPRALIFSIDRLLWLKDTIKDKIFPTDVKEPACNIYHLNWEDNDEDKFLIIPIDVVVEVTPNILWNVMKSEEIKVSPVWSLQSWLFSLICSTHQLRRPEVLFLGTKTLN